MNKRKILLLGLAVIVLVVTLVLAFKSGVMTFTKEEKVREVPAPLDTALDFYSDWLAIAKGTTTNPYDSELVSNPILSPEVKQNLLAKRNEIPDPFFCQNSIPEKIGAKLLFELPEKAEVIILNRTASSSEPFSQAIVTLEKGSVAWVITKIACSSGEVAPESEFSFEQDGYLLKSMQSPYVSGQWHLVFSQNGTMGYVAPLIFSTSSVCVAVDGTSGSCDINTLTEMQTAKVTGNMFEEGAEVVRLELR